MSGASGKNSLKPWHAIVAGDMTGTLISPPTNIQNVDNVSIELDFTGNPVGTFFVEVSNTYDRVTNPTPTWIILTLTPTPVATGTAGVIGIDYNQSGFQWVRVRYVPTSGGGSLDAWIGTKSV